MFLPGIRACIFHAGGRVPKKKTLIWQRASEITPIESHRNVKARNISMGLSSLLSARKSERAMTL